jgi:hypothetical protein
VIGFVYAEDCCALRDYFVNLMMMCSTTLTHNNCFYDISSKLQVGQGIGLLSGVSRNGNRLCIDVKVSDHDY